MSGTRTLLQHNLNSADTSPSAGAAMKPGSTLPTTRPRWPCGPGCAGQRLPTQTGDQPMDSAVGDGHVGRVTPGNGHDRLQRGRWHRQSCCRVAPLELKGSYRPAAARLRAGQALAALRAWTTSEQHRANHSDR